MNDKNKPKQTQKSANQKKENTKGASAGEEIADAVGDVALYGAVLSQDKNIFADTTDFVGDIGRNVGEALGNVGETLGNVGEAIGGAVGATGEFLGDLFDGLS